MSLSTVMCTLLLSLVCYCSSTSSYKYSFKRSSGYQFNRLTSTIPAKAVASSSSLILLLKRGDYTYCESITDKSRVYMIKSFVDNDHRYRDVILKVYRSIILNINRLKDYQQRILFFQQVRDNGRLVCNSLILSFSEGTAGERGEGWMTAQVLVVLLVLSEVPLLVRFLLWLSSLLFTATGVGLILSAFWELKENASPFLVPLSQSRLVTGGAYEYLRHPMYGGVVLLCLGLSVLSRSSDKLFLTVLLTFVLVSYFSSIDKKTSFWKQFNSSFNAIQDKMTSVEEYYLIQRYPSVRRMQYAFIFYP